jgi:cytidylate kinase
VAVVTVSRQFGAGGLRVARMLAESLGYRLVDRELVEEAARHLGVDPQVARSRDERAPALVEELGLALAAGSPELGPTTVGLGDQALAAGTGAVIRSLADAGDYVILGRGGQAALADRRDACHIALVGGLGDRVRRIVQWQGVDEQAARAMCDRVDAERAAYVRRFYGVDIRDPVLYDCVLNTSRMGIEGAAATAASVARRALSR